MLFRDFNSSRSLKIACGGANFTMYFPPETKLWRNIRKQWIKMALQYEAARLLFINNGK